MQDQGPASMVRFWRRPSSWLSDGPLLAVSSPGGERGGERERGREREGGREEGREIKKERARELSLLFLLLIRALILLDEDPTCMT